MAIEFAQLHNNLGNDPLNIPPKYERVYKLRKVILLLLLPLALAYIPASAQENCFPHQTAYLAGDMNIRSQATTNSVVVATARAGDSFTVLQSRRGGNWCWLQVSQGWMAKTTRVGSAPQTNQPQPQQPSNVDNCCYVNRQCVTNEDWTNGYWAFQNNECPITPAPAPAPQNNPVQQSSIDNCCFLDRQCHTEADWKSGYEAFQNNQCSPASGIIGGRLPIVEGDEAFRAQIARAFEFLEANSHKWFNYIVSKMKKIVGVHFEEEGHFGDETAGAVNAQDRVVKVSIKHAQNTRGDIPLLVSTLIHEACHLHQFDSGKYSYWDWLLPIEPEQECYQMEAQALSEIAPGHPHIEINQCQAETYPFMSFCGWSF